MKSLGPLAAILVILLSYEATARAFKIWTYRELYEASDIVIVGVPIAENDLPERTNIVGAAAIGVMTTFKPWHVMKGTDTNSQINVHHYRYDENGSRIVLNGPGFQRFEMVTNSFKMSDHGYGGYLLYLKQESAGIYIPVAGQIDVDQSIRKLEVPEFR